MRLSSLVLLGGLSTVHAAENLSWPLNTPQHVRCGVDSIETAEHLRYCMKYFFEISQPDELVLLLRKLQIKLDQSNQTIMVHSEALELAYKHENFRFFLTLLQSDTSTDASSDFGLHLYIIRALRDEKHMLVKRLLEIGTYEPSQLLRYATSNYVGTALILKKFPRQISFNHHYTCFRQMILDEVPFANQFFAPAVRSNPNRWISKTFISEASASSAMKIFSAISKMVPENELYTISGLFALLRSRFAVKTQVRTFFYKIKFETKHFIDNFQYILPSWLVLEAYAKFNIPKTQHYQDCLQMHQNEEIIRSFGEIISFAYFWTKIDFEERFFINMFFDKHSSLFGEMANVVFRQWPSESNCRLVVCMERFLNRRMFANPEAYDELMADIEQASLNSNSNPLVAMRILAMIPGQSLVLDVYTIEGINLLAMHAILVKILKHQDEKYSLEVYDSASEKYPTQHRCPLYYTYGFLSFEDLISLFKPLPSHDSIAFGHVAFFEGNEEQRGKKQLSPSCTCMRFRHYAKVKLGIDDYMVWKTGLLLGFVEWLSYNFDDLVRVKWKSPDLPVWKMITKTPYFEKRLINQISRMKCSKAAFTLQETIMESVRNRFKVPKANEFIQASV